MAIPTEKYVGVVVDGVGKGQWFAKDEGPVLTVAGIEYRHRLGCVWAPPDWTPEQIAMELVAHYFPEYNLNEL